MPPHEDHFASSATNQGEGVDGRFRRGGLSRPVRGSSARMLTQMTAASRIGASANLGFMAIIALVVAMPMCARPVSTNARTKTFGRWAVCYSARCDATALTRYDLVVLDAVHHPALAPMLARKRTVLAYLSLTEMGRAHDAFSELEKAGVVLDPHPTWTGTHYIDVRRPEWRRIVLDRLVPRIREAGFSGLFLDTLDDAAYLEAQDAARFSGTRSAAARLVREVRQQYPRMVVMVNRGYDLLPEIATSIDIVLGESVVTTFDSQTGAYRRLSESDVAWQRSALHKGRSLNPRLELFTLDYWDPADRDTVRDLYRQQRANGFSPYVSIPMLDRVVEEP